MKGDSFAADAVWRPVRGRQPVCRIEGCREPALDDLVQLCAGHGGRATEDDGKAKRTPRRTVRAKKTAPIINRERLPLSWGKALEQDFPRAAQARRLPQPYSLVAPGPWEKDAACKDSPTGMFYADATTYVKAICAQCLVKQECLAFALDVNERFGVWGGLSEQERARLRKRQRAQAA